MTRVRFSVTALVIPALLLAAMSASAQSTAGSTGDDTRAARARSLYQDGMARFQLDEYDKAIELWEEGFRAKPAPEFLYNIAQAHRLAKRYDRALSFYQKFLRLSPSAPNRAEVERHIKALTKLIDDERRTSTAPPTQPRPPSGREAGEPVTPAPATAPAPAPATAPATPAPVSPAASPPDAAGTAAATPTVSEGTEGAVTAEAPQRKSKLKPWVWAVIGVGAAVVVGGVVVGVVLGTQGSSGPPQLAGVTF